MAIQNLTLKDAIASSTYFAINQNGQDYRVLVGTLSDYIIALVPTSTAQQAFTTQYASPSATGFSVQITQGNDNIHLILTPTAGYAAGTIVLPTSTGLADKQEVLVNCTQQVTALTITGNGATVTGEPTSLSADAFFRLKYDLATNVWYRVG
jgi:hypothetical protein